MALQVGWLDQSLASLARALKAALQAALVLAGRAAQLKVVLLALLVLVAAFALIAAVAFAHAHVQAHLWAGC
jgi:hypothetical protein